MLQYFIGFYKFIHLLEYKNTIHPTRDVAWATNAILKHL